MTPLKITTDRIELIAGTPELALADINDRSRFSALLDARVPDEWPPPLNDIQSMRWFERYLIENPDGVGWVTWYFILRQSAQGDRVAIGNGGFKGNPTPDGSAEVGYSVLKEFQRFGYATEATRSLVAWAFEHQNVNRVIAETYPILTASIRVMEKNGFVFIGEGSEEGVIRYAVTRQEFQAHHPPIYQESS